MEWKLNLNYPDDHYMYRHVLDLVDDTGRTEGCVWWWVAENSWAWALNTTYPYGGIASQEEAKALCLVAYRMGVDDA